MTPTDIQVFGNPPSHAHYVPALGYNGLVFCSGVGIEAVPAAGRAGG